MLYKGKRQEEAGEMTTPNFVQTFLNGFAYSKESL